MFVAESRKWSGKRMSGEYGGEVKGGGDTLDKGISLWHWSLVGGVIIPSWQLFRNGF